MVRRIAISLLIVTMFGCASAPPEAPRSEYNLGVDAYRGKDYRSARQHWANAVEQRELSAYNNLGYLLFYGLGGEADRSRAIALWREAAELGHSEAQWHMGHAFEKGEGVIQSAVEAYAWYRCAIANAQAASKDNDAESQIAQDASRSLTQLMKNFPAEKLAASEQLAKQYISKYAKQAGA